MITSVFRVTNRPIVWVQLVCVIIIHVECIVSALMPGGMEIPTVVRGNAAKGYDVEFITRETGVCISDIPVLEIIPNFYSNSVLRFQFQF